MRMQMAEMIRGGQALGTVRGGSSAREARFAGAWEHPAMKCCRGIWDHQDAPCEGCEVRLGEARNGGERPVRLQVWPVDLLWWIYAAFFDLALAVEKQVKVDTSLSVSEGQERSALIRVQEARRLEGVHIDRAARLIANCV